MPSASHLRDVNELLYQMAQQRVEYSQALAAAERDNQRLHDAALEAEGLLVEARRLLLDLTPGGSEFVGDPRKCAEWAAECRRKQRDYLVGVIIQRNAARRWSARWKRVACALWGIWSGREEPAYTRWYLRDSADSLDRRKRRAPAMEGFGRDVPGSENAV